MTKKRNDPFPILVLGIGNVLLGDEGVGVHVVRYLEERSLPEGVTCLDGGTGGFTLLDPMSAAKTIFLVDATNDGSPPGTVQRLRPRYARDYPPALTAHDIGLKDLLDSFYLISEPPDVHLFAISVAPPFDMSIELSPELAHAVPRVARMVQSAIHELVDTRASNIP